MSPLLPVSAYGTAKRAAEDYLDGWNRLFGSSHVALRFGNVYGPRQSAALEAGCRDLPLADRHGRPDDHLRGRRQTRDYVLVATSPRALLAARRRGGVFNVGTGDETSSSSCTPSASGRSA